mmetsp:Transcript_11766/g.19804  ORF Transcript_11766/g.19804 Transcript_11766/m.19804 type:complete len:128 (-) Transcript_11766:251-634(-)
MLNKPPNKTQCLSYYVLSSRNRARAADRQSGGMAEDETATNTRGEKRGCGGEEISVQSQNDGTNRTCRLNTARGENMHIFMALLCVRIILRDVLQDAIALSQLQLSRTSQARRSCYCPSRSLEPSGG